MGALFLPRCSSFAFYAYQLCLAAPANQWNLGRLHEILPKWGGAERQVMPLPCPLGASSLWVAHPIPLPDQ